MTRFAAPRVRPLLTATALLFVAAGAGLRTQNVAAPPARWPTPLLPEGLALRRSAEVRDFRLVGAVLHLKPVETAATK
jgi:hypothetical protein